MAPDRLSEIENEVVVLHFVVTHLLMAHCEREENPVEFAQGLLAQMEELFDRPPPDDAPEMPEGWKAQIRERMTAVFGQVVSLLLAKTSHHDA